MSTLPSVFTSLLDLPNKSVPSPDDIAKKIQNFFDDIKRLRDKITYLKDLCFKSQEEQQSKEIIAAFEHTIQDSLDQLEELAKYFKEQDEIKTEALLLEAKFLDLMIKVLASIIKFQAMLNSLYPDASNKIIDYLDHVLIAILATHMPLVALVVQASRNILFEPLINTIKSKVSTESVTQIKERLEAKSKQFEAQLTEIRQGKSFQKKYQIAEQIFRTSEKTGYSPLEIAELGLNVEELQKCDQKILSQLIESKKFMETFPTNSPDKITEVINGLKQEIIKIFENILGHSQDLKNSIDPAFAELQENLRQGLDPTKNISTRIASSCRAVTGIFKIEKLIKEKVETMPEGAKIILEVGKLIHEKNKTIFPSSLLTELYRIKSVVQPTVTIVENAIKRFFLPSDGPAAGPSNSRGRA